MVSRRFQRLSALGALGTLSALRPVERPSALSVPQFFSAWLAAELAPHNLAVTVGGTAFELATGRVKTRGDKIAVGVNVASAIGLAALIQQGWRSSAALEDALVETLGEGYLDPPPAPEDLATPWKHVAMPFLLGRHPDVVITKDIPYGERDRHNLLDVYRHRDATPDSPVLLQIHGGAWMIGHKAQQGLPLMMHLASRGWICVAPNYGLSPKATWPEQLLDVKRALAWVRTNIDDHAGDPQFVAVTGGSAGGHLTALLGLTPNDPRYQPGFEDVDTRVQAAVPHYGVYDFADTLGTRRGREIRDRLVAPIIMKRRWSDDPAAFIAASPIHHVRPDAPPFFVIHGTHDSLASVVEAREFVSRLRDVSTSPVVYAELAGTQHAFDVFPSIRSMHVVRAVERFLSATVAAHRKQQTPAA